MNNNELKEMATPENVVSLLTGFSIPKKFDFLSLDIDCYDYFVLEAIYQKGFKDRPMPNYYKDYPFDVAALQSASPEVALEMVQTGFAPYAGKFSLTL